VGLATKLSLPAANLRVPTIQRIPAQQLRQRRRGTFNNWATQLDLRDAR